MHYFFNPIIKLFEVTIFVITKGREFGDSHRGNKLWLNSKGMAILIPTSIWFLFTQDTRTVEKYKLWKPEKCYCILYPSFLLFMPSFFTLISSSIFFLSSPVFIRAAHINAKYFLDGWNCKKRPLWPTKLAFKLVFHWLYWN